MGTPVSSEWYGLGYITLSYHSIRRFLVESDLCQSNSRLVEVIPDILGVRVYTHGKNNAK